MPSKKRIVIFGNYGGRNWGDEAILCGLLSAIPCEKFEITIISSDPSFTKTHLGVNAIFPPPFGIRSFFTRFSSFLEFIKVLRSARFVVFGGGGLFQDREHKAVFLWSYYYFWAWLFHKTCFFVAQSVGPLNRSASAKLVHLIFSRIPFISLRDSASEHLLIDLGIDNKRIIPATDAIFLFNKLASRKKRHGSLVMLRGDGDLTHDKVLNLFQYLPLPITAIPMDVIDREFLMKLGIDLWVPDSVDELRKKISGSELVLSSRLHGNLLALLEGTPFVGFAAAPKVKNFFMERGLGNQILSESTDLKKIASVIVKTHKESNLLKIKMQHIRKSERRNAEQILPHFLQ